MEKFVLIDGFALLHRAYHAFPKTLTTRSGELINAAYGFTRLLLKVNEEMKPDYWAVAVDLPGPTFRNELFVGYQAQRPTTDEELIGQVERVYQILGVLNVPVFGAPEYEADDVIGSVAKRLGQGAGENCHSRARLQTPERKRCGQESGNPGIIRMDPPIKLEDDNVSSPALDVIIVTGDRDILQLVGGNVSVYLPQGGFAEGRILDSRAVEEYLGVRPDQIVDFKALVGDASDNYPGVPGIGPKTAIELIKKYRNLEGIYTNIEQIKESVAHKLKDGRESALLSQKLAKIAADVKINLDLEACRVKDYDREKAVALFKELEFRSLMGKLPGVEIKEEKKKEDNQMGLF